MGIPSGNQVCLHSGFVESQGHFPGSGKAEPSLCGVAEGPCLPITRKEAPTGLREKLDLDCFVWWPLGQGAALPTVALVTQVHGPHYSHALQSSLLLDAMCRIFVSS